MKGRKKQEVLQKLKELEQFKPIIAPSKATKPSAIQLKVNQRLLNQREKEKEKSSSNSREDMSD